MSRVAAGQSRLSVEMTAALALGALYFALMSGHLHSIDGLLTYRQAESFAFEHSIFFSKPLWPDAPWTTSKYGIGLSLLYVPGLLLFSWLRPYVPMFGAEPFDFHLYYDDPYYAWAAAPVHVLITVAAAYLVGRFCRELGLSRNTALAAMLFYGLGSPVSFGYGNESWTTPLWLGLVGRSRVGTIRLSPCTRFPASSTAAGG